MKKPQISLALALFLLATGSAICSENDLVGTWEFVSGEYTHGDGSTSEESAVEGVRALKVVSDTHFCLIALWKNGTMNNALGGTYEVEGDTYTERIEYAAHKNTLGLKGRFTYRLEKGQLRIEGTVGKATLKEVWRRVP